VKDACHWQGGMKGEGGIAHGQHSVNSHAVNGQSILGYIDCSTVPVAIEYRVKRMVNCLEIRQGRQLT